MLLPVVVHNYSKCFFGFGGLGGNNGRQSWLKDFIVSLSTPEPACLILLGAVGPLFLGVTTYAPRKC